MNNECSALHRDIAGLRSVCVANQSKRVGIGWWNRGKHWNFIGSLLTLCVEVGLRRGVGGRQRIAIAQSYNNRLRKNGFKLKEGKLN